MRLRLRYPTSRHVLTRLYRQINGITCLTVDGREVPRLWTGLNERYRPRSRSSD